jgi:predicted MFS family arabinose efflux permease
MRSDLITIKALPRSAETLRIRDGLRYVRGVPDLLLVTTLLAVFGVFSWNFNVLVPLLTRRGLQAGADVFGILLAGIGVGALAAALSWARGRAYQRRTLLLAAGIFSCFEVAAGVAPNVGLAFLALVAVGYCHTIYNSASLTALQLLPPEELRTRTVSLYTLLFLGLQPIGSLLSGYLADGLGIRQAMVIEGLACLTAVGAASIYARRAAAN